MSSLRNPVGPEESSTYWRRRAIVIVVLVFIMWLLWFTLRAVLRNEPEAPPSPSPSAASPSAVSPSGSPQARGTDKASPSPGASKVRAAGPAECPDEAITVGVRVPSVTTVGSGVTATMTVTNTGRTPCTRDLGAGANEVTITSGSTVVWSSDFCSSSSARDVKLLEPGTEWATSVSWPGKVTSQECPPQQATAQAGAYRAVARNGSVVSGATALAVR